MFRLRVGCFLVASLGLPHLAFPQANPPAKQAGALPHTVVSGNVLIEGSIPKFREWMLDDAIRRATGEQVYRDETWIVGKNMGLANCVVALTAKNQADRATPGPQQYAVLDKEGVRYVPHVLVVTPGTQVILRNKTSPCRGFLVQGNPALGHTFPLTVQPGTEQKIAFRAPDTCPVSCPGRPYTKGYIKVVDTTYFAVTDANGHFAIPHVPAGDYLVDVWHEAAGELGSRAGPTEIRVAAGGAQTISFRVKTASFGQLLRAFR